jgi:uncharacterized membrane protein required for colicin V production
MLSLIVVFWLFVVLFAIIGLLRGWAKELLVTFSMILALFIIIVMETYLPIIKDIITKNASGLFIFRFIIIGVLTFFGYQTPSISKLIGNKNLARERLQDALLGLFIGALNGYLIVGSLWFYLDQGGYPFPKLVTPPTGDLAFNVSRYLAVLPPTLLVPPGIFFAVAVAFAFVLMVLV